MAGEVGLAHGATGQTLYFLVRNSVSRPYNTVSLAFEVYNSSNYVSKYVIAMAEEGSSGYYAGDFPAVAAGVYEVEVRLQAGGSPVEDPAVDAVVGTGEVNWSGTAVQVLGIAQTGDSFARLTGTGTVTFASLVIPGGATITQSTTDAPGLSITGNGTGHGAVFISGSGATGNGIYAASAATGGHGMALQGSGTGNGLYGAGGDGVSGDGAHFYGGLNGNGLRCEGRGAAGTAGLYCLGGAAPGILAASATSYGVSITGGSNGAGLLCQGAGAGAGAQFTGGGNSGPGLAASGGSVDGIGFKATGTGSGHDVDCTGDGVVHGTVTIDLTTAIPDAPTQGSIGDALLAAEAQGVGRWTIVGTTLTLYRHDGVTVARVFTLNSATAPTART